MRKLRLVQLDLPRFVLDVDVSGGFYVRQLISDIGDRLEDVGAVMTQLVRTRCGPFTLDECISLEDCSSRAKLAAAIELCRRRGLCK